MLKLTMKGRVPNTILSDMNEESNTIERMPLVPLPKVTSSFGTDFNLIRMVKEYGPQRIAEIDAKVKDLQHQLNGLVAESEQIQKLVAAIQN